MSAFGFTPANNPLRSSRGAMAQAAPAQAKADQGAVSEATANTAAAAKAAAMAWAQADAGVATKPLRRGDAKSFDHLNSAGPGNNTPGLAAGTGSIAWKTGKPVHESSPRPARPEPAAAPTQPLQLRGAQVDLAAIRAQLQINQQQWKSFGLEDYSYTVQQAEDGPRVKVNVVDGKVASRVDVASGQLLSAEASSLGTIDDMFAKIRFGLDHRARQLEVEFDSGFGYPTYIFLDMHGDMPDKNIRDLVTSFRI